MTIEHMAIGYTFRDLRRDMARAKFRLAYRLARLAAANPHAVIHHPHLSLGLRLTALRLLETR